MLVKYCNKSQMSQNIHVTLRRTPPTLRTSLCGSHTHPNKRRLTNHASSLTNVTLHFKLIKQHNHYLIDKNTNNHRTERPLPLETD